MFLYLYNIFLYKTFRNSLHYLVYDGTSALVIFKVVSLRTIIQPMEVYSFVDFTVDSLFYFAQI